MSFFLRMYELESYIKPSAHLYSVETSNNLFEHTILQTLDVVHSL
jgi:hypothetical protein